MFTCIKCNYDTTKKSDWNKHIITKKHKKLVQMAEINKPTGIINTVKPKKKVKKVYVNNKKFICEYCGKLYKFRSGLSRHTVKCNNSPDEEVDDENDLTEDNEDQKEDLKREELKKEELKKEELKRKEMKKEELKNEE